MKSKRFENTEGNDNKESNNNKSLNDFIKSISYANQNVDEVATGNDLTELSINSFPPIEISSQVQSKIDELKRITDAIENRAYKN